LRYYDVVIVGAGSAGCVTARRCTEMGLKTVLIDKKSQDLVGQKVCGDEISKSHFDATGIDYPAENEVSSVISGADVYPPNLINELKVRGWTEFDGWTVNRLAFGQRLLNEAIQAGAKFLPKHRANQPLLRDGRVIGVEVLDIEHDEIKQLGSKLLIDASGFAGVIRNKIDNPLVENTIAKEDIALCYRDILSLKMPLAEPTVARVFLGGKFAPQGYAWIFPKGIQQVNTGVGITGGKGRGSPKAYFETFKKMYPLLFGSTGQGGNGGAVPVRHPLMSLVADGVAFVGDAASQVNPIHGGGIGPGMRAGIILGEVAKESIARKKLTAEGLWTYNTRFLANFGRRLASLEIFRRLLQTVSDDDMNFGFEKRLLESKDLMAANRGDGLSLSMAEKMRRVGRGISRIGLLRKIQKASKLMKKISRLYAGYPNKPDSLDSWYKKVQEILNEADFS
jgi:digeranylgeranylglycerophospholipid reductase